MLFAFAAVLKSAGFNNWFSQRSTQKLSDVYEQSRVRNWRGVKEIGALKREAGYKEKNRCCEEGDFPRERKIKGHKWQGSDKDI